MNRRIGLRVLCALGVTATAGAVISAGVPAAHAAVSSDVVTLSQATAVDHIGANHVLTATVASGGSAVPNGTPVQFQPQDGLLSDHVYGGFGLTSDGGGYWLSAYNGTVRAFGDATSYGGAAQYHPATPLVSFTPNSAATGYYQLAAGGGVYCFGSAAFYGSATSDNPGDGAFAEAMAYDPAAGGYWIMWSDGTIDHFGAAPAEGNAPFVNGDFPVGIVPDPSGTGYWIVYEGGSVRAVGSAASMADFASVPEDDSLVAAAANSAGTGLWGLTAGGTVVTTGSGVTSFGNMVDNNEYDIAFAPLSSGTGYFGLGADGQVFTGGAAVAPTAPRDAWTALTTAGVAKLAVTGTFPGYTTVTAAAGEAGSNAVNTEWTEPPGYWLAASGGGVFAEGDAAYYGSPSQHGVSSPVTAIASTPDGLGYWVLASGGGVYSFGSAQPEGAVVGQDTNPWVGIASLDDDGYLVVARDGKVVGEGDQTAGDSALGLTTSAVGIALDPYSGGYWVVSANGGVFALSGAQFYGSAAHLSKAPIVALYPTPDGGGYWVVNSIGSVFAFGDATYEGGANGKAPAPIVGLAGNPLLFDGYWTATSKGTVLPYGSASSAGSVSGVGSPIVGITPDSGFLAETQVYSRSSFGRSHTAAQRLSASRHLEAIRN